MMLGLNLVMEDMIGKIVKVKVDRKLGSAHPDYPEHIYPINYGYIEGIIAPDGEEQDVYILGVDKAVDEYEGELIAVIKRDDDEEEKWVIAPIGIKFTVEEIEEAVRFQFTKEEWEFLRSKFLTSKLVIKKSRFAKLGN